MRRSYLQAPLVAGTSVPPSSAAGRWSGPRRSWPWPAKGTRPGGDERYQLSLEPLFRPARRARLPVPWRARLDFGLAKPTAKEPEMTIAVGDSIPDVRLRLIGTLSSEQVSTAEVLGKGRVVLFGVPAAFSPTCSDVHLPGFILHADDLHARGVDRIFCVSVNDHYVMAAWGRSQGTGDKVSLLADGNGDLARPWASTSTCRPRHGHPQPALCRRPGRRGRHSPGARRAYGPRGEHGGGRVELLWAELRAVGATLPDGPSSAGSARRCALTDHCAWLMFVLRECAFVWPALPPGRLRLAPGYRLSPARTGRYTAVSPSPPPFLTVSSIPRSRHQNRIRRPLPVAFRALR